MSTRPTMRLNWQTMTAHAAGRQIHVLAGGFLRSLLSQPSRLLRFLVTGTVCGAVQILLLHVLTGIGWNPIVANAIGFLLSAQLNFLLSYAFTWGDRSRHVFSPGRVARRWVMFHSSIAGTALLNMVVFSVMSMVVPNVAAAAIGIGVASLANFLLNDRLVFKPLALAPGISEESIAGPVLARLGGFERNGERNARPVAERVSRPFWALPALGAVSLLAGVLYLWNLSSNGMANEYYAAAVLSMTKSWSNFFFASLDPGGFITVDKPPFAFWVEALSARLFGFSSWSILAPQALAGIASVLVIHHLVRRTFGDVAAIIAALVLALTPITVAITRDNMPDAILVLLLVLAAWAVLNAMKSGRFLPALIGAALVGVAFNTKMLQAYLVVPGLGFAYLLTAHTTFRRRAATLVAAGVVLAVVSASWLTIVDAIPADARPYIGGSTNNTVLDLVLGYNGLSRVFGNDGVLGADAGGGGANFGGPAGWLRMFGSQLATQISWLLPLSAVAFAAGLLSRGLKPWGDEKRGFFLLCGGWLATHFVVFSLAEGTLHPYYTISMGPAIAALAGAGLVTLWGWYRHGGPFRSLALPGAIAIAVVWPAMLVSRFPWGAPWLQLGIVVTAGVAIIGLLLARLLRTSHLRLVAGPAMALGVAAILLGPGVWSVTTLAAPLSAINPTAGPSGVSDGFGQDGRSLGQFAPGGAAYGPAAPNLSGGDQQGGINGTGEQVAGFYGPPPAAGQSGSDMPTRPDFQTNGGMPGNGGPGTGGQVSQELLDYLLANKGNATFIVAAAGSNSAAPLILATGQPVIAMGGFTGSDPAPILEQLQSLIASGKLRYVLQGGSGDRGGPGDGGDRSEWLSSTCTVVDPAQYGGTSGAGGGQTLYDCSQANHN